MIKGSEMDFVKAASAHVKKQLEHYHDVMTPLPLKDMVKTGEKVIFQFYRKGELHYKTSSGFYFIVPIDDCGDAEFLREDKAIIFMRYIRKQLEVNKAGQQVDL